MIEKYYNEEGEVGVLVSPGYGAGFSTWTGNPNICFDKDIIECVLNDDRKGVEKIMAEKYNDVYFGCDKLIVEFLKPGTVFEIKEYDGAESLRVISYPENFLVA